MSLFKRHPAALVQEHDDLVKAHQDKLADLKTRVVAKGTEIGDALAQLRSDHAMVKALESRLG